MNLKKQFYTLLNDIKADFTPEQQREHENLFDQCQKEISSGELKEAAATMGRLEEALKNEF